MTTNNWEEKAALMSNKYPSLKPLIDSITYEIQAAEKRGREKAVSEIYAAMDFDAQIEYPTTEAFIKKYAESKGIALTPQGDNKK